MQVTMRKLMPAALVAVLALAGCAAPKGADGTAKTSTEPATAGTPAATKPSVEFYIATNDETPGMTAVRVSDGTLYMQRMPVLTRADLSEAQAMADPQGQNYVGLRFTEAGARKLAEASSANIGKRLALVVDNELVVAPLIAEPLNRGVLAFGVPSVQAATSLAAQIRGEPAAAPAGQPAN